MPIPNFNNSYIPESFRYYPSRNRLEYPDLGTWSTADPTGRRDMAPTLESIFNQWSKTTSGKGIVRINGGVFLIDSDLTVPAGIRLEFGRTGTLMIADDATLTILGDYVTDGDEAFLFNGTGTGVVSMQGSRQRIVSVMDFGADPTGITDSSPAIQRAADSNARKIVFPIGTYRLLTTVRMRSNQTWELEAGCEIIDDVAGFYTVTPDDHDGMIYIDSVQNVRLIGEGVIRRDSGIDDLSVGSNSAVFIDATTADCKNVYIEGIIVMDFVASRNPEEPEDDRVYNGYGLRLKDPINNISNIIFQDVTTIDCSRGFHLRVAGTGKVERVFHRDCQALTDKYQRDPARIIVGFNADRAQPGWVNPQDGFVFAGLDQVSYERCKTNSGRFGFGFASMGRLRVVDCEAWGQSRVDATNNVQAGRYARSLHHETTQHGDEPFAPNPGSWGDAANFELINFKCWDTDIGIILLGGKDNHLQTVNGERRNALVQDVLIANPQIHSRGYGISIRHINQLGKALPGFFRRINIVGGYVRGHADELPTGWEPYTIPTVSTSLDKRRHTLELVRASQVNINGVQFYDSFKDGIRIENSEDITISNCEIFDHNWENHPNQANVFVNDDTKRIQFKGNRTYLKRITSAQNTYRTHGAFIDTVRHVGDDPMNDVILYTQSGHKLFDDDVLRIVDIEGDGGSATPDEYTKVNGAWKARVPTHEIDVVRHRDNDIANDLEIVTATPHGLVTDDQIYIDPFTMNVTNPVEEWRYLNVCLDWTVTVVDANTLGLQKSVEVNPEVAIELSGVTVPGDEYDTANKALLYDRSHVELQDSSAVISLDGSAVPGDYYTGTTGARVRTDGLVYDDIDEEDSRIRDRLATNYRFRDSLGTYRAESSNSVVGTNSTDTPNPMIFSSGGAVVRINTQNPNGSVVAPAGVVALTNSEEFPIWVKTVSGPSNESTNWIPLLGMGGKAPITEDETLDQSDTLRIVQTGASPITVSLPVADFVIGRTFIIYFGTDGGGDLIVGTVGNDVMTDIVGQTTGNTTLTMSTINHFAVCMAVSNSVWCVQSFGGVFS